MLCSLLVYSHPPASLPSANTPLKLRFKNLGSEIHRGTANNIQYGCAVRSFVILKEGLDMLLVVNSIGSLEGLTVGLGDSVKMVRQT